MAIIILILNRVYVIFQLLNQENKIYHKKLKFTLNRQKEKDQDLQHKFYNNIC